MVEENNETMNWSHVAFPFLNFIAFKISSSRSSAIDRVKRQEAYSKVIKIWTINVPLLLLPSILLGSELSVEDDA
jgi:hypothetical protein